MHVRASVSRRDRVKRAEASSGYTTKPLVVRRLGLAGATCLPVGDDRVQPPFELGQNGIQLRVLRRRAAFVASPANLGERPDRSEVVRSQAHDLFELVLRVLELSGVEQGPSQRHVSGEITGVLRQAAAAQANRFVAITGAPVFFGQRREGNRRRVLFDPALQFFDPRMVRHRFSVYGRSTVTDCVVVARRPAASSTVNVTMYSRAAV